MISVDEVQCLKKPGISFRDKKGLIQEAEGIRHKDVMKVRILDMFRSRLRLKALCIIIAIFSSSSLAEAFREHHVALSGSDTLGNGTLQKPWRTIKFAVAEINGGDIVTIHGGTYSENYIKISPSASGSKQHPTIIRAADNEKVTIYGLLDKKSKDPYAMGVHDASHVRIEGLKIIGYNRITEEGRGGTLFISGSSKPCTDVKIANCELINSGTKLGSSNPSIVVFNYTDSCEISNCKIYSSDKADRTGIKIWRGTSRLLVQGNDVFNLMRKGIDNKHGGRDKYLIIRNNYVHDIGHIGIHLNGDGSLVEDNVLYKCDKGGIVVWRNEGSPGGSNSILNHNTIVDCGAGVYLGSGSAGAEGFRNCTVTNNIILNCSGEFRELTITPYGGTTNFDFGHIIDYNCYFNNRTTVVIRDHKREFALHEWQAFSGQDEHSVQQNPNLLGGHDHFKDLCDFRVSTGFAKTFKASDGRVIGADIHNMKNCPAPLPPRPSNVRISVP